jgi:hypothetical protein
MGAPSCCGEIKRGASFWSPGYLKEQGKKETKPWRSWTAERLGCEDEERGSRSGARGRGYKAGGVPGLFDATLRCC